MRVTTGRALVVSGAAIAAGAGLSLALFGWLQSVSFTSGYTPALWSWSLRGVETTSRGVTTIYEPFALLRNVVVILFCGLGSTWFALSLMRMRQTRADSKRREQLSDARQQLDFQLDTALKDLRAHAEKNHSYSAALAHGQLTLEASHTRDEMRSAIKFLLSENEQMRKETQTYERKLGEQRNQVESLRAALMDAKELSMRDALTRAYTRGHFDKVLSREVREAKRAGTALSLIMVDIDHFKKINDTFGHPVGDEVLKAVAELMMNNTKGGDCVARYGGEEFAIVLPATRIAEAAGLAEQIREKLASKTWVVKGETPLGKVTASFGVAQLSLDEDASALIARTDSKLYASKSAGRNRVTK